MTGCVASGEPVRMPFGWVANTNWLAAAELTMMLPEVALVSPDAVKLIVIVVATLWDRFAKFAIPLTVVAVRVPCNVPVPALRVAVMTRPLSVVTRLPAASSTRMTGCCANGTPAVAADEGCVWIVSLFAAPTVTGIGELVADALLGSVMSVAVTVCEPAV